MAVDLTKGSVTPKVVLYRFGKLLNGKTKKVRINPLLSVIVNYIHSSHSRNHAELYSKFSDVRPRTLREYLKQLQELKWIRRHGREYHINSFLSDLIEKEPEFRPLFEFASLKLDLFDILNLPLLSIMVQRVKKIEIQYYEYWERYTKEIFKGLIFVIGELESGQRFDTILPVNLHGQATFGKEYLPHYCIPLKWQLFDIQQASFYSTNNKRSHHKGAINQKNEFIHFDNSISLLFLPKGKIYFLWQKKFFEQRKTSIKHWQGYEYLEVNDLEVLKRLLTERFVNGKRGLDLFDSLNMTYKRLH